MRFLTASLCALCVWSATVVPASAGWDNVFQTTLFWRQRDNTAKYYAPPVVTHSAPCVAQAAPCNPCPQQKCTTNYVQRSYYQPVTTYENRTVMESVTTYRSSYYYEPVTSYRYSSYYDPSSCCVQQVAVPTTTYQLREQKCPVQSWVSRCVQVPVQAYQKVDYWQPQTTCCTTTQGTPICANAPPQVQIAPSTDAPPSISGQKTPATKPTMWDQYYPPMEKVPEIRGNSSTSLQPKLGAPIVDEQPKSAPPVKMDRIAVGPNSTVDGQVVGTDNSPKADAKVLFINAYTGQKQMILANTAGRFQAELAAGSWHVYLHGTNDSPVYHSRIDVNGAQFRQVNLVSRSN